MGDAGTGEQTSGTLSPAARTWRMAVTVVVLLLLLAGSLVGTDAWFPVGPFKMYARATSPDATITMLNVEAVTVTGEVVPLKTDKVLGLRRAELEGNAPRIAEDPSMLGALAEDYRAAAPETPELVEVRLVGTRVPMKDGRAVGEGTDEVRAVWVLE